MYEGSRVNVKVEDFEFLPNVRVSMLNSENQQENFLSTSFRRPCVVACATDETKLCETAPINPCSGPHLCTKI